MSQTSPIRSSCLTPVALCIVCLVPADRLGAQQSQLEQPVLASQAPVTSAEFDRWMAEVSNWGRWGAQDERGTLNLITPQKRQAAARLVQDGVSVSLALDLNTRRDALNANPFEQTLTVGEFGGHEVAGDAYRVDYHGFAHSHMDGLPHFLHKGTMYNGVGADVLEPGGATRLGIHNAHDGVFSRGVLVDVPWLLGVDYLEPGFVITADLLEFWEQRTGIRVGSGDVLLVRTGRWERVRQKGQWNFLERAAGMHASVAKWLKARDVAVIGCDGVSDVMPSGVEDRLNPLHELVLVGLGMPILDNLDLDAVAAAARERQRWEFLYVGTPLRVVGGTGSPLNPLAVF
jgi:kynurenine formamidase